MSASNYKKKFQILAKIKYLEKFNKEEYKPLGKPQSFLYLVSLLLILLALCGSLVRGTPIDADLLAKSALNAPGQYVVDGVVNALS